MAKKTLIKPNIRLIGAIVGAIAFFASLSVPVQAQQRDRQSFYSAQLPQLPDRGSPIGRRRGGTSRYDCPSLTIPLTALVPGEEITGEMPYSNSLMASTVAEYPTFWVYIPKLPGNLRSGEFVLQNEAGEDIYRTILTLPQTAGALSITLPSNSQYSLKTDRKYHWEKWSLAIALVCLGAVVASSEKLAFAQSQIVPDNTLGDENSQVITDPDNPQVEMIDGGARRDINLFHSFQEFNVNEGRAAYFTNPTGVENILGRVTGGNPSEILGRLGVLGNANLFLINPNGILFGSNASLDIKGSFVATSASAIQFGEQGFFGASSPQTVPLLTVNPSALLFNQIAPGRIENQSLAPAGIDRADNPVLGLRVPDGQSLLLVGGDVVIDRGGLNALGGRVELGGIANEGRVEINDDLSLNIPAEVQRTNVSLNNGAFINVAAEEGGAIVINAKNINLSESILLAGIAQGLGSPNAQAGDIKLNATDAIAIEQSSILANFVGENAIGNGGDIQIESGSVSLKDGSQLITNTSGVGNGGLVSIQATEKVELSGRNTAVFSEVNPNARGNAGGISIETGSLLVNDSAFLLSRTFGRGNAGDIKIVAQNAVAIVGRGRENPNDNSPPAYLSNIAFSTARGNSGNINIEAGSVALTNFAAIDSSNFDLGNGNAGNVVIKARDSIFISESGINALSFGIGNAGNVVLEANAIATELDSFIDSSNLGQGNSGNISFQARSITMKDPFIRSQIVGTGQAGDLTLIAEETILLTGERTTVPTLTIATFGSSSGGNIALRARSISVLNGIVLNALSEGKGDGGTIDLDASTIKLNNSLINASAFRAGKGGSIRINATESIEVSGRGLASLQENLLLPALEDPNFVETLNPDNVNARFIQGIVTPTTGAGNAGAIEITTARLNIRDGALSATATVSQGEAGTISLAASESLNVDGAVISASTVTTGLAGNIEIDTARLSIDRGGQIVTTTLGLADGGNLLVNASNSLELSGTSADGNFRSSLSTGAQRLETTGDGGNLTIVTPQLTIRDGAEITASTLGQGNGGNIRIDANSVNLSNGAGIAVSSQGRGNAGELIVQTDLLSLEARSRLLADTVSGEGGNIQLRVRDLVLLRDNSSISTTAGSEGAQANGGNIEIDTNFLVTVPSENNDITANAFEGRGGFIQITAQGIFGLESRERLTPLSDITAFSQQNPQLDGVVDIDSPDVDVSREIVVLPSMLVNVTQLIAQRCSGDRGNLAQVGSEFILTGRGGLPPQPSEALRTPAVSVDEQAVSEETSLSAPLVEATGWTSDGQGRIVLVAATANELRSTSPSCYAL